MYDKKLKIIQRLLKPMRKADEDFIPWSHRRRIGPSNLFGQSNVTSVSLTWTHAKGVIVDGYRIFRDDILVDTIPPSVYPIYNDSGLTPVTNYEYKVEAFNKHGLSMPVTGMFSTTADTEPPSTPVLLSATYSGWNGNVHRVDLSWSASTDNISVAGYRIYRDSLFLVDVGNTLSYLNTTVLWDRTLNYQVTAYDTAGNNSSLSNSLAVVIPADTEPPSPPPTVTATYSHFNGTYHFVNVSWTAATDNHAVTGYKLYRYENEVLTAGYPKDLGNVLSHVNNTGLFGRTFTYKVTAYDQSGNESTESASQPVVIPADTTAPTAPVLSLSRTYNEFFQWEVDLTWTSSSDDFGVKHYKVLQLTPSYSELQTTTNTLFSATYSSNDYREYVVYAEDYTGKTSNYSNMKALGPLPPTAVNPSYLSYDGFFHVFSVSWTAPSSPAMTGTQYRLYTSHPVDPYVETTDAFANQLQIAVDFTPGDTVTFWVTAVINSSSYESESSPLGYFST